jgi:hypothetical protein
MPDKKPERVGVTLDKQHFEAISGYASEHKTSFKIELDQMLSYLLREGNKIAFTQNAMSAVLLALIRDHGSLHEASCITPGLECEICALIDAVYKHLYPNGIPIPEEMKNKPLIITRGGGNA